MWMNLSKVSSIALILVLLFSAMVVLLPEDTSADAQGDETDTDFNNPEAEFTNTEVVGTGPTASVQLLRNQGNWVQVGPPPDPGQREGPAYCYDEVGGVMVVFGGYHGGYKNDTWEYDYSTNTWTETSPDPSPPEREWAAMAYDSTNEVCVLFGGYPGPMDDTWEYDVNTNTWENTTSFFGPDLLNTVALAFDSSAGKVILVGEDRLTNVMRTWAYDASMDNWVFRTEGSPSPSRFFHAIAYDASIGKTVLFGGATPGMPPTLYDDTWEYTYSSNTWSFRGTGGPSARYEHVMAYKSSENAVYLFGGRTAADFRSDTYKRVGGAWELVGVVTSPPARASPAFVYDSSNDVLILCCGYDSLERYNDTWVLGMFYTFQGFYRSRIFDTGADNPEYHKLYFNQSEGSWPSNTEIRMRLASATTRAGPWNCVGWDGTAFTWNSTSPFDIPDFHDNHRYIRYCADLISYDGGNTPSLDNVTITYTIPPVPPYLVATVPSHATPGVDPAACMVIDFSEEMNQGSVAVDTQYINPWEPTGITFDWTWSNGNTTLTLCPQTRFHELRGVWVWVNGTDLDGLPLEPSPPGPGVENPFFFTTTGGPPYIALTDPANTDTDVPQDADVVITWSEPMDTSSVTWAVNVGTDPGLTDSWNSPTDTILTLTHVSPFLECEDIELEILTAKDKSGNDFEPAMGMPNPWSFKIVCLSPYVVNTDPTDGDFNVEVNRDITVWFSEAMNAPTLVHDITPSVSLTPSWPTADRLVVTHPNFQAGVLYTYCVIDIEDLEAYHLYDAPYCIDFMTASTSPYIVVTSPADGATDVDPTQGVFIAFSEEMNVGSVTWTLDPNVPDKSTWVEDWDPEGLTLTLTHAQPMIYCGEYTFEVTGGRDLSGNNLIPGPVPNPWSFNTTFEYPCVMYTDPEDGAINVDLWKEIVIDFSEPIDTGRPFVFTVGPELSGTVWTPIWSNGSRTVTLNHSLELYPGVEITVGIWEAYDLDNNPLKPGPAPNPFRFYTVTAPDWPALIWTSPSHRDIDVATDVPIIVQFDETMDTSSVVWIIDDEGGPSTITFTPTWSQTVYVDDTLTLNHVDPLRECQESYWVEIQGKDLDGHPLVAGPAANPFSFDTICILPHISSTDPIDQDVQVPLDKSITIVFNKEMQPDTLEWVISPDPGDWTRIWSPGNATVMLSHATNFDQCTVYNIQVTQARDLENNNIEPGPVPNPWTFTSECISPYIVSTDPQNGQADVPLDYEITVTFSEPMDTGTVVFEISPALPFTTSWSMDTVLTVHHTDPFVEYQRYDAVISAGKDKDGNDLIPGPSPPTPNPWFFNSFYDHPTVIETYPPDGGVDIPVDAPIIINFSEPMNTLSVSVNVDPSPGGWQPKEWGSNDMSLWWNHSNPYENCSTITVTIQSAQDKVGLDLVPLPYIWSFETFCPNPRIIWTDPFDGELDVEVDRPIRIKFKDPMNTGTVTWTITPDPSPGSWGDSWAETESNLTLTHPDPFQWGTVHTFCVTGGEDKDGYELLPTPPICWQFRTILPPEPPDINWTIPPNGQSNVDLAQDIIISFTTEIVPATLNWSQTMGPSAEPWTESWSQSVYPNDTVTLSHVDFSPLTNYRITIYHAEDIYGQDLDPRPQDLWFSTRSIVPPPGGLTVTKVPPSTVRLTWSLVTGATHYNIYDSTNKFAAFPGGWNMNQVAHPTNTYDFAYLGDGQTHYFVVRAWDSGISEESTNSTMGVKIEKSFAFSPVNTNVHWMSLPFISEYTKASDIANELTESNVNVIAKWDRDKQRVESYYYSRGKWRGKDFTLSAGDGFYVSAISSFSWDIVGTDSDASVSLPFSSLPRKQNRHWISVPYTANYTSASDIVNHIEGDTGPGSDTYIVEVGLWDSVSQSERVFYYTPSGWTGDDFAVSPGEGIFLKVVQSYIWSPWLVTPYVA